MWGVKLLKRHFLEKNIENSTITQAEANLLYEGTKFSIKKRPPGWFSSTLREYIENSFIYSGGFAVYSDWGSTFDNWAGNLLLSRQVPALEKIRLLKLH